jgi:hypothetical protein
LVTCGGREVEVIAMRRLAVIAVLGALLGMVGGLTTASPALARGPEWQVFPAPPFTLPATYCGFDVGAAAVTDKEFVTILQNPDGSTTFLVTGTLTASFTNLETGKTVIEDGSGPAKITVNPDGSVIELRKGPNFAILTPAEAARFGLPTVSVTAGALTESLAPDGTVTSASLQGHVLADICAALR